MERRNESETHDPVSVPWAVYRAEKAERRAENIRHNIVHILSLLVIAGIVAGFLIYLSQYDVAAYDYTQDGEGMNIMGNNISGNRMGDGYYEPTPASAETFFEEPKQSQRTVNAQID